jgi:hypothetical protein
MRTVVAEHTIESAARIAQIPAIKIKAFSSLLTVAVREALPMRSTGPPQLNRRSHISLSYVKHSRLCNRKPRAISLAPIWTPC